ncbi:MAG: EAL domain-containing protein [Clostridia bacterium]|nr:EAL domain-containing protein [Clostridia bacterium]
MKSIRSKIMWLLFFSVLISIIIIGTLAISLTSKVITKDANENMNLLCQNNADKLDIIFAKVEDSVDTLAHFAESELFDLTKLDEIDFRAQYVAGLEDRALHHIESTEGSVAVYMYFSPALINKTDGFFLKREDNSDEFKKEDLIVISDYEKSVFSRVDWWSDPSEQGSPTWLEAHYNSALEQHIASYVVPIYRNKTLVGIIGADISTRHIEDKVKQISVLSSGKAAVLKEDGTVVYHPNFTRDSILGEGDPGFAGVVERLSKQEKTNELIPYTLNGTQKRLASYRLRNGMIMICFAPVSEIYREQHNLIFATVLIALLISSAALLVALFVSSTLARPIKKLNEAAKHLTEGEYDFNINSSTHDEIGELTDTFIETRKILMHQFHLLDTEAHKDGLTGVGNKSAFIDREKEINKAISEGVADFYIAVFDVNKLKITNDVFGHMAGDKLLCTAANHLSSCFGIENVFRVGGDEFIVIISETDKVNELLANCIHSMKQLTVEGYPECNVSCAYGASRLDTSKDRQLSDVLHRADEEMYKNKRITKKETLAWQEGAKGIKQLQFEKYCQLVKALTVSTDDYLFIMNTETGVIRFFGKDNNEFEIADGRELSNGISEMLNYVHPSDHKLIKDALTSIINRETENADINIRMHNIDTDERLHWVNCRGSIINDETDNHFVLIGRISQNAVKHLYNPLTTLFNKTKLKADLQKETALQFNCLMLLDIDNLSEINLKHGAEYGDNLLKFLAEELENRFSMWQIYHTEKDRFVVLLNLESSKEAEKVFLEIKKALSPKCSISASVVPNDKEVYINVDNIYDYAVQILNQSKKNGNGNIAFFSKESIIEKIATVELLEELEESIKKGCKGFYLAYQPQINANDYSIISAEALLRFESKTKGQVYPDVFIPLLEQTGLINEVGIWVIDTALSQCQKWREYIPNFKISVNISPKQLEKKSIAPQITRLLAKHNLPGGALILEITESSQLDENEDVLSILEKLRYLNIQIAIDDFGTGYSNLGNLKRIHANILKVDRIFIRDIKENGYNYNLIQNIIEFAKANSLKVCLEGIETTAELMVISSLNPDVFQGYLFDRPCTPSELEEKYMKPDTEKYTQRIRFIEKLSNEKKHTPVINIEMKTILKGINIGLWIIRINKHTGESELYTDDTMRLLLGVDDTITPKECYSHWYNSIIEGNYETVNSMVEEMLNSDKVIQAEYLWKHPQKGETTVRCTGRCIEKNNDYIVFEGFHRIISDMGKSF